MVSLFLFSPTAPWFTVNISRHGDKSRSIAVLADFFFPCNVTLGGQLKEYLVVFGFLMD